MARQNGIPWITETPQVTETFEHRTVRARPSGPAVREMDGVWDPGTAQQKVGTRHNLGAWAFTGIRRNGVLPFSAGQHLIFERVWVEPVRVDAGFITEELTYSISIWNAFQSQSVAFTSMASVNPTGTSMPTPSLPVDIRQSDDILLTLTIDETGPPIQDTYYKPLVNGVLYSIYITGVRVLGLAPGPTWEKGIQIRYGFQTSVFQTERFEEQRRPLMDSPYRTVTASFPITSRDAHQFFYDLAYGHDKIFGVPIYNEMLLIDTITQGSATITTTTPTANMYNLNNLCTHVIVVDHGTGQAEIKQISSIGANSIVVTRTMVDDFEANSARVYPIFFGTIQSIRSGHLTDDVAVVELELEEFNHG
jgi:hypothetical protein